MEHLLFSSILAIYYITIHEYTKQLGNEEKQEEAQLVEVTS